jgi:hypothetical protein
LILKFAPASHPPLTIRKHVNEILAMLHSPIVRIRRLLDGGLIEIGLVIRNGAVTALKISGMLLQ